MWTGGSRYERPLPDHRVQIDVKFIAPLKGTQEALPVHGDRRLHQDPGPSHLRPTQPAQRDPVPRLRARKLPFRVEVTQTDHGAEFGSQFHYHVLDRGIGHVYIKPASPRLNGKVERSHRIDEEEFYRMLKGVVIDDTELFNDRLREWEDFYNFNRPHG